MSLSTQDRPTNPSKFFLKVKSGGVQYYDKEQGENIDVPVPLEFYVLDQLGTIKGWSDADNSGIWSNEVKSSGKDPFTVKTSKGTKAIGLWKEIKNDPAVSGAKFNASVYIAHKSGEGLVISNIAFQGAALNAWIEFIQANKGVMKGKAKVVLSGFADAKKGAVKYQVPLFETTEVEPGEVAVAKELDEELQEYLSGYFDYQPEDTPHESRDVVVEDIDDNPIDLSEIPF